MTSTALTRDAAITVPLICGAMYPCSNPELVAAASEAGGIGIVQPVSLTYVHGYEYREGLRAIQQLTKRPVGFNALIEGSSRVYRARMERWLEIALEEGIRFVITSLGNPRWVADRVHAAAGKVYHDVTERRWALKARDAGVDGLIAVNRRAGGHPGPRMAEELLAETGDLGLPVVCAGGIGSPEEFATVVKLGYDGAQLGTRFIATTECTASDAYKRAILEAREDDIVWSERLTGVPVAVIRTPLIDRIGLTAGWLARRLLRGRRTKHWMRAYYTLRSLKSLKSGNAAAQDRESYWQAGKSVASIDEILPAGEVVRRFSRALPAFSPS
ncbi:MAG: nitronate monooxygenase [Gemmatimonadales bacterium]